MIYQKMLVGQQPYQIFFKYGHFEKHKHPEIELVYCIEGELDVVISKKKYAVKPGDLVIIGSMRSHEFLVDEQKDIKYLVIEAGPVVLSAYFDILAKKEFPDPVVCPDLEDSGELKALLDETADVLDNQPAFSELVLKGNLYKIYANIFKYIADDDTNVNFSKNLYAVSEVEKAIEIIHSQYDEDLKTEDIAELCGYSTSNFCKIFKNITGDTFHNILNTHRIEVACSLLKETNSSVEDVATRVGFADSKAFCRVFKAKKGISPGKYRKG